MGTPSRYEEHPPPPPLAPFVECLWTRTTAPGASVRPHRVLPDGCLDILLTVGAGGATATAVGAMTRPLAVRP
ncbi:MAG TPA: DUF6597 domain-containing transcriptional factor, partial [Gemmatimonadaceae bacterium]|nr:DUF6597 domain-containing transcriptional factor [Gemmatimonadaceae bacterium]